MTPIAGRQEPQPAERDAERRRTAAHAADDPLLLTVPQAARLLGIGTTLAYELAGQGRLPHIRLGRALRVPRGALEAWIEANSVGGAHVRRREAGKQRVASFDAPLPDLCRE